MIGILIGSSDALKSDLKHENFAASVKIWKSMIYPLLITVNELKLKGWIRAG